MATAASRALSAGASAPDADFYRGKLQAARYYVEWELPVVRSQCELLRSVNAVPLEMRDGWFQ
jgi:butyryl-CoA dehydrogenase